MLYMRFNTCTNSPRATNHLKSPPAEQPRSPSPPPPGPGPPTESVQPESRNDAVPAPSRANDHALEIESLTSQIETQKQTISLLVSEKNTITSALERLEGVDVGALILSAQLLFLYSL